ncbi:NADH dehydrogenase, FAD-containing subunit [Sphaerochaeta pleomorpha str. Grapes]|uniref:NADH:ubiquinone reductase (non-electrogenic) n=1 Tax=Sphaerochaeta pleomorpha (strain ATCC BAA-1885 / DSM 22778 / Grapes) TaxID=158190 RepID=G8QQ72_SPHPG|nr:FAD-dependent oxidoreductase [Sphaerochaeta pleomorpha]AEV28649.1 NADH dehydrogenase, FAD-containing subunit [Sphaerochaeta pleomorpha str. Grapes]
MEKKRIVILGGGYAGVHAAKKLHKAFKKMQDKVEIILIDRNRHHILMTELHEVAGNRVDEESVKISYERIFAGKMVTVVQDEIESIDFEGQKLKGKRNVYAYDQLIISTGAEATDFRIPGVKDHAFYLWSLEDALRIRTHVEQMVKEASFEPNKEKRAQLLTFVVAGGGFTGVELVGELIEWLPLLCKKYGVDYSEVNLINAEALGSILNMLPEKPRAKAVKYMQKKGVKILLNSLIVNVDADGFTTKDGTVFKTKTLIWTCGIKGSDFCANLPITEGKRGRMQVSAFMQCPDHKNVYLAGDGLWYLEDNNPVPQIVEAAEQTAATAAEGIIHTIYEELGLKTKPVKPFKSNFHGFMVSLGGKYAVSHTGGFSMSGFFAQMIKHLVNMYYQAGVCGINGAWTYFKHEILQIKNKRSLIGGMAAYRVPSYWVVFLRMYLGVMWLIEGIGKIKDGWLTDTTGGKVYWDTAATVWEAGADAVGAASEQVAEVATAAVDGVTQTVAQFAPPLIAQPLALYTWINTTFVAQFPYFFQLMIVLAEVGIGLCFIGGLFTFPAAIVSLGLSIMFLIGAMAGKEILWYMAVSIVMLGGAGRAFGLDYWVMPYLKKVWNKTPLAKKTYLFMDEPEFTKKQMAKRMAKQKDLI